MAMRMCFSSEQGNYGIINEELVEFVYSPGFSISQKQRSIQSLHDNIKKLHKGWEVLEVSTKSSQAAGVLLSAFNLQLHDRNAAAYPLECIFQSSKKFESGGPYRDLLSVAPGAAKRDERLKTSGHMVCFEWENRTWDLEPKTFFYDWLYVNAVSQDAKSSQQILKYNAFTDIEFNHKVSFSCQARSAAIFVSLMKLNLLSEALSSPERFRKICYLFEEEPKQMSMNFNLQE